jgi:hypothetical protein
MQSAVTMHAQIYNFISSHTTKNIDFTVAVVDARNTGEQTLTTARRSLLQQRLPTVTITFQVSGVVKPEKKVLSRKFLSRKYNCQSAKLAAADPAHCHHHLPGGLCWLVHHERS